MTLAHIAEVLPAVTRPRAIQPRTLDDLIAEFEGQESLENPDLVLPTNQLRLTTDGTLAVPGGNEAFALTDWARKQLSCLLGIRWDTWFDAHSVSAEDRSDEVNKRLHLRAGRLRLRTSRVVPDGAAATGTLRALVSPLYTPLSDALIARMLRAALAGSFDEVVTVAHLYTTSKSVSAVLRVGAPFNSGSSEVGDIAGTLTWVNSGVGFRAAALFSSIQRLCCKNGLVAPVGNPVVFKRSHRGFDEAKVREALLAGLAGLPNAFRRAARVLVQARSVRIIDARPIMRQLLEAARVPLTFLAEAERAYEEEPNLAPSAFAISQAITRAAQRAEPEQRFELERVAGAYLAELFPSEE